MTSLTAFGRLTRDPELRYTKSGHAIANFSLACNSALGKEIKVAYIDFVAFGGLAESIGQLRKGSLLMAWGSPVTDSWDDKSTGAKRSKLVFTVTGLAGGETHEQGNQKTEGRGSAPPPKADSAAIDPPIGVGEDDVPFHCPPRNSYRLNL